MTGTSRSVAALAETAVRVAVGHVVSHGSMVTRAYLTDLCAGILIEGAAAPWLISTRSALLPDPEDLKLRAERTHQIPSEYGRPQLLKITLSWGGESAAEVKSPKVIGGSGGAAAVPLTFPASLAGKLRAEDGPQFVSLAGDALLKLGDAVGVALSTPEGALMRWGRVASDPGYAGHAGAVAIGVTLTPEDAGSPVFVFDGDDTVFCGLVEPIDSSTALLVTPTALAAATAQPDE